MQVSEILRANEDQLILSSIKACSVSGDIDGVERFLEKFREHSEHIQEVCLFLLHVRKLVASLLSIHSIS